ncbi:MAG TPA: PAS domain S-box protein [Rhizomicrobium sp.]|nr:PAS domain S-box protein [Rhizomicrobium sp.]
MVSPKIPELVSSIEDEQLRRLLDSISDYAIFMLTPEGRVASWNAGAFEITGYRSTEIMGQSFARFFRAEDLRNGLPDQILSNALKTGRSEREGWQIRKDGTRFWAITIVRPAHNSTGELIGFAQITRDITERRAAQKALLDSEHRFRLLVEGVTDYAIYMLDPSGIVTNWNSGAERLKGYTADEIVGQHFSRFYPKEERAAGMPARVLETAAREGRYEAEGWRIRKDGSRFWASVVIDAIHSSSGELLGFGKVTRDISERRTAQQALRESERQFRLLVEGVRDYAIYMLDPNGIVASWNSGAERIKGYQANEIIGHHFSRFYVESDRAAGMPTRALATAEQEGRFESEGWRVRKDGSTFWASEVIDRIRDEKGNILGFAKITRDATERREAQLALQSAQAERHQAQKMEALGHLTGGVAHDFNNLLMIISGQNHTLKRLAADNPRGVRAVEGIETAIARGASLTRQLLSFSRRQALDPRAIEVGPRLESFKSMLLGTMGGLTVLTSVPPGTWPITVDPNELELALLNLVINARDAMPSGGTIAISAENATLAPKDTPAGIEGEFVAVTVSDTGTGIAPDVLPKIFDPFFTTKQVNKGSGLGLSQVHGFTHQSGGTVTIDSELGKGTSITLFLPRSITTPAQLDVETHDAPAEDGAILLVEDNPEVAEATQNMLQELGYTVETVKDSQAALHALSLRLPRLVLTDIIMPGEMDGVALARKIREQYRDLSIVLLTGYSRSNSAELGFPLLRKPFNLAELGRTIRATLAAKGSQPDNLVRLIPPHMKR